MGDRAISGASARRGCCRFFQIAASLLIELCAWTGRGAADDYQLGRGYDLGPLNIAGYSNVVAKLPMPGEKSLSVDDLSLFVTGHFNNLFNPFVEAELTDLSLGHSKALQRGRGDGDFVLERLYNDSYLSSDTTLRIGKMLSPVGEWNEIHAAPLVLTTTRPAVTFRNFSEYTTGASLRYTDPGSGLPDVQLYLQPTGEFSERPHTITVHQYRTVGGGHLSFPFGLLDKVGFSFQQSKDVTSVNQSLYGLDYHYTLGALTLQGEATFSDVSNNGTAHARDTEWGAYAAASYALTEQWSLYSWYETFADRTFPTVAHDLLFGVAFRPQPEIVFRVEYLQNISGHPANPTGLFASWAVLF